MIVPDLSIKTCLENSILDFYQWIYETSVKDITKYTKFELTGIFLNKLKKNLRCQFEYQYQVNRVITSRNISFDLIDGKLVNLKFVAMNMYNNFMARFSEDMEKANLEIDHDQLLWRFRSTYYNFGSKTSDIIQSVNNFKIQC